MPVIKRHQTLLDFALQYTGSAEGLIQVALLNGFSITDDSPPGADLAAGPVINLKESSFTTGNEISTYNRLPEAGILEGIGYWIIAQTFKVS